MASREENTLPATRPKSRKSLGHVPSAGTMDKENMTTDFAALASGKRGPPVEKLARKSRSKSIGPGGLDALKDTAGNRRKSLATVAHPPPKSILKPTIPPLREIPAHISTRKPSPKKPTPPSAKENNLINFDLDPTPGAIDAGAANLPNPFTVEGSAAVNETRVTLRTEEEQEAAARERDEKDREELEKQVISRRDARRKSLANRRVSFAPEATLHTWDVVVEYQDSTTSSNGTRRASSASGGSIGSPHPNAQAPLNSDPSEPPSTPPEQVDEETVTGSPEHQRDLHQKKRRRSSGIPPLNFNNPDEDFMSSSPFSGDSAGDVDEAIDDDAASNSNSDSVDDDGTTMMSLDGGETTDMSMASVRSASSTGSNTRLEASLREAAEQAGTQGIDFDEHGLQPDEEIVASFAPWSTKKPIEDLESRDDQENINPFAPRAKINRSPPQDQQRSDEEEMTMDITSAIGGILPDRKDSGQDEDEMSMDVTRALGSIIPAKVSTGRRQSVAPPRRQSSRRRSSGANSSLSDATMDFTMAVGGIQNSPETAGDEEDMTMDFTAAVGSVLGQSTVNNNKGRTLLGAKKQPKKLSRVSLESNADDETMDMTVAVGSIMPSITTSGPDDEAETMGMEMTTAIGGILQPQQPNTDSRNRAKMIMEMETDLGSSPFQAEILSKSPPRSLAPVHTVASETGSPSFAAFRGKGLRRSNESRTSTTPKSRLSNGGTPIKKPTTPSKQLTPQPPRPTTPGKTPPSKNVIMRTSSPKRLFKDKIKASSTPQSSQRKTGSTPNKLFQHDLATGIATPSYVLTPQKRRSSGLGLDKTGLGSPRVAAILDRRRSIGEQAKTFIPSQASDSSRGVRFENPHVLENEIDDDRQKEEAKESGRMILEREADQGEEKDATINLKELIQSLTPKKKSMKGRKSLHVGAGKGILGKRPIELDEDDEDDDQSSMKRLKGHQASPVKSVKLQGPPSKEETTGRVTRATRKSLEQAPTTVTPRILSPGKNRATTPRNQGRFKDAEADAPTQHILPPSEKSPVEEPEIEEEGLQEDPIQLQDFLNMTSIRFMELTTTKRRHTIAPRLSAQDFDSETPATLEDCVAAGAATIPMLELFEHSCKELKSYIAEGRKTVREIESETFEENPPLFREYISATPDMKIFMDNQLKNVKTHARLLSKGMWYDWRMALLETLKEGLFKSAEGMIQDEERLDEQQALIDSVLPQLIRKMEVLQAEEVDYQDAADELANCDPEQLGSARQRLIVVDADVAAKKQLIAELQRQLQIREAEIEAGILRKQAFLEEISEAEKVREECRGWTSTEISALKDKVDVLEKQHGWVITGVSGSTTSMTYKKEIELVFDASSFYSKKNAATQLRNSRLDLWYIGTNREVNPMPLTVEKDFFLQGIRDHIRSFVQAETRIQDLLRVVGSSWNKAVAVTNHIRLVTISCPTEITKTSDTSIQIKSTLLIAPLTTKVNLNFHLNSRSSQSSFDVEIEPSATVVYGERFNEPKMGEFLLSRVGNIIEEKNQSTKASWGDAVAELAEKLLARGRK